MKLNQCNKRPRLVDIKSYAPIAGYSNLILILYRLEYYKIQECDDENPSDGEAEIIIVKNANGKIDYGSVKFDGAKSAFGNFNLESFGNSLKNNENFNTEPL